MRAMIRATVLASSIASVTPAGAQDASGWHQLEVPGGRATLRTLGVDEERERSAVMVELIRRFIFAITPQAPLEASLRAVRADAGDAVVLPLPLAPETWSAVVFERAVPHSRLFVEILVSPPARLLFHGLAGLDRATLRWIEGEHDLLRWLYRDADALKSFAMFAPSVQVTNGQVVLRGDAAMQRWPAILDAKPEQPARFVRRLFADRAGRTAGLFAIAAFMDETRRSFLLGATPQAFARLVSGFAQCYPGHANDYPLAVRSYDPALLLMDIALRDGSRIAGPYTARFWDEVFASGELSVAPPAPVLGSEPLGAAGLVDRLCAASAPDRADTFATLLAGPRVFRDLEPGDWPEAVLALRVRRRFPSAFMAMEQAGMRRPAAFVAVGRHARQLDRLSDMDGASTALRQFQGGLALTLNALVARTFSVSAAERLVVSLAAVPLEGDRYADRIAGWLARDWLPAVVASLHLPANLAAEQIVVAALSGPSPALPPRVTWEDVDYVVDFPAATRRRLRDVRQRQGGLTLDEALAAPADESRLAQVLASWAYAPHLGTADGGALVGGDSSVRHDVGLRSVNRTRFEQRWQVAPKAVAGGAVAGSYLGLVSPLASWSLRRLASDRIPPPPTIGDNELASLFLSVALSDHAAMTDEVMMRIAASIAGGSAVLEQAFADGGRLIAAAQSVGMSPWRVSVLPWMLAEEPQRVRGQFSLNHRARLGGLRPEDADAWGTASLVTGCLCLRMPRVRIPELILGRPADGIVGSQSADLTLRIAVLLTELKMPAALATPVLAYAMRDYLDAVRPSHPADLDAFARQAPLLTRTMVEDYLAAIAAVGALRPVAQP